MLPTLLAAATALHSLIGGARPLPHAADGSVVCRDTCLTAVRAGVAVVGKQLGAGPVALDKVLWGTEQVVAGTKFRFVVRVTTGTGSGIPVGTLPLYRFSVWAQPWLHSYKVNGTPQAMSPSAFRHFIAAHGGSSAAPSTASAGNGHTDPCAGHAFVGCMLQFNCNARAATRGMLFSAAACRCVDPRKPCPVGAAAPHQIHRKAPAPARAAVHSDGGLTDSDGGGADGGVEQGAFVYVVMAAVAFLFYWAYKEEMATAEQLADSAIGVPHSALDDDDAGV